jgi:hypothetical protein
MFFVNRTDAINQLHDIHEAKHKRARHGSGEDWIIPIADNVIGLGKSEFGRHYIPKSRELWKDVKEKTIFQKILCSCHTVHITFKKGELSADSFDSVMLQRLSKALSQMFVVPPAILSNIGENTATFLEDLVDEVGPLFIVLDEIGDAFDHRDLNDFEKRERFLSFCNDLVGQWLSLEKVFFVLLGRASFLSYVGLRPNNVNLSASGYVYERLNLHLLRPDAIKSILMNTRMLEKDEKSVAEHIGLCDQQTTLVADALYRQTNGHPRSILAALKSCKSYLDFINYNVPIYFPDWKLFYDQLFRNREVAQTLLSHIETGSTIDLTRKYVDFGKKELTYAIIANNSFISWEGTIVNAKLYTHPFIKSFLENILLPLQDYLKQVGNASRVSLDYPTVFEWMFLKRFQEIFSKNQQPSKVQPLFFNTPVFGSLCGLAFSSTTRLIPKITKNGNQTADLDSETAHPNNWQSLIRQIDELSDVCLKPRSKSASSDAFLISEATSKNEMVKVTV